MMMNLSIKRFQIYLLLLSIVVLVCSYESRLRYSRPMFLSTARFEHSSSTTCSIVVITSPSPLNPDTTMIKTVIESAQRLFRLNGMNSVNVHVICDGYKILDNNKTLCNPHAESKSGKISSTAAVSYEQFCADIQHEAWKITKMNEHMGFALCVEHGLRSSTTPLCLVLQHDRVFIESAIKDIPLSSILQAFFDYEYIRYIGFPTVKSSGQDEIQHVKYDIFKTLLPSRINLAAPTNSSPISLHPLIFW